jgi:DNA-binding CsgD family transcriptional regulator
VWPLVGRGDELALALDALRRRRAVVFAGAAGVGKTRLARAALAQMESEGAQVRWVTATRSARTMPLGAFAHLVPRDTAGPREREGQDVRAATLDAVVRAIEHHVQGPATVIGVDDAHLLDDASATLIHLLATGGVTRVVATVRSGEPPPDPVVALWKDDLAVRLEVQPLSRIEVADLLGRTLRGTVDGATARRLFDVTRGNVLFLRELVASGLSSGALAEGGGVWAWDGPLRPGVPLRDLIADRLGALDEAERDALELLAVGEPLVSDVLDRLVTPAVVRRLERRSLVESNFVPTATATPSTTATGERHARRIEVRLGHPLFGEVLVHEMSPLQLAAARRQLAEAWEAEPSLSDDELLRVANWRDEMGDHANPELLLAGATRALVLGDIVTGERLARSAHQAAPTVRSAELFGGALHSLGRDDDAIAVWKAGQELPGTPVELAHLACGVADLLAWGKDRAGEARAMLRETAERLDDPEARDLLSSHEALLASLEAPTTGRALAIAQCELDRPDVSLSSKLRARLASATALVDAGQIDQAIATSERALRTAIRAQLPGLSLYHAMTLAQAMTLAGRLPDAVTLVQGGHELAISSHADVARGAWCFLRGCIGTFQGRPVEAAASLRESDLLLGRFDYGLRRGVLTWLGMAEALAGNVSAAEQALAAAQQATRSRARLYDADWARAQAWTELAAGRHTQAMHSITLAASVAVEAERWTYEMLALHDRARFGDPQSVVDRLDELTSVVVSPLAPACAAHARAQAAADGEALDAAAVTFTELGFDLFAAEAQISAVEAHRKAGRRARAQASAERARRLADRCREASTPLLRGLSSSAGSLGELTRREREIAELAARGRTDKEIAEDLFLSVRTVHAHLRSAYAKLGVSRRTDLPTVLALPLDPGR